MRRTGSYARHRATRSKIGARMKIGVLYNCQGEGIAVSLRALLPDATIINFVAGVAGRTPRDQAETAAALNDCDHVISCDFGPAFGKLAGKALRRTARRYHAFPAIRFSGFHPDMIYVPIDGGHLGEGPTGDYHSRIAVIGFLAGLSPGDTAALYNRLIFLRLGYLNAYAEQCALLTQSFADLGLDAAPLLPAWHAAGSFMHSLNHPKINVLLDVARAACTHMGVAPQNPAVTPAALPDRLATGPIHPVFPAIAAAAGVPPEGSFRNSSAAPR
ncbi:MAG: WcbI family polysaccharide biosynthesis putative acetyltransferase [Rhodospirillales bacterium]